MGLLDHLAHANTWTEHGLARRLLPKSLADVTVLDTLLLRQPQQAARAWLDDLGALRVQLHEQCQARGVEPFLDVLNGYFWEIDQATEALHRETCAANVEAGLLTECVALPSVGDTMESYLDQEQQKLDAERDWREYWRKLPADLRTLLLSLDPAHIAKLGKLELEQVRIVGALARLVRLRWLIHAKFGYGPQRVLHPRETVTYQDLRRNLLADLRAAGLDTQEIWASDGIPERLSDVGTGKRTWDIAGIERLEEDLIHASATKRVDELVAALDPFFVQQGIDGTISEIEQTTWQANASETHSTGPELEAHRPADGQPADFVEAAPNGPPPPKTMDAAKAKLINGERRIIAVHAAVEYLKRHNGQPPPSAKRLFTVVPKPSFRTWQRWTKGENGVVKFDMSFDEVVAEAQNRRAAKQP
jgi:hypothetical protein